MGEDGSRLEKVNGGKRRTYVILSKIKIKRKKKDGSVGNSGTGILPQPHKIYN